jgi:hypothetical protein
MKHFIASSGVIHRFTKKKLQIATPKQDKWLVWLSRKGSHSDPVELKTDLQTKNMVSANAITALRRLWDADSYASNPAPKYLIQEKNRIGRFCAISAKISGQSVKKQKSYAHLNFVRILLSTTVATIWPSRTISIIHNG